MEQQGKYNKRKIGATYERAVGYLLEQEGYVVVAYNYRCPIGELDIIARDGEYLVFCEVKYRKSKRRGSPLEAVNLKKQKVIYRCATHYLMVHDIGDIPCRFDVIGIEGGHLVHLINAFGG